MKNSKLFPFNGICFVIEIGFIKKSVNALISHEGHWKSDEELEPNKVRFCAGKHFDLNQCVAAAGGMK
ncbi:hypothetical protein [Pseudalkalibacillus salsuginis]|uniref:hypothetical protein n=1 Tax=Pseudalkalibacillus salsuginis TaxID=2910972 RepID=UPI001F1ACF5D|nr:hypothetical protein [Pseudalkalibacillus salsuginis]MCF6411397.1 hypothetical protein [Pseudalkalibacillus salsuginis]